MSGIFSVAFCKWHHIARGCSAKLCSPSSGLQQQMKSSLAAPLTCQHGLAVGKHGTELFINTTLLISCLLWSNLQCVLGLFCLNTAGSSEMCPREPQSSRRLQGWEGIWSPVLMYPEQNVWHLSGGSGSLSQPPWGVLAAAQDPSWIWAGSERSQQVLPEVKWRGGCAGMGVQDVLGARDGSDLFFTRG